jgi:hypothetical protein
MCPQRGGLTGDPCVVGQFTDFVDGGREQRNGRAVEVDDVLGFGGQRIDARARAGQAGELRSGAFDVAGKLASRMLLHELRHALLPSGERLVDQRPPVAQSIAEVLSLGIHEADRGAALDLELVDETGDGGSRLGKLGNPVGLRVDRSFLQQVVAGETQKGEQRKQARDPNAYRNRDVGQPHHGRTPFAFCVRSRWRSR